MVDFLKQKLTFTSDKIYFIDGEETKEVMMDWELPIMEEVAKYITNEGSATSILEIGFGMGISAKCIQQYKPSSHIIIEAHPEIIIKAKEFAQQNEGVTIIEGDWYDVVREGILGTYDGIFYDVCYDLNCGKFREFYPNLIKKGGRVTWWNPTEDALPPEGAEISEDITFQKIDIHGNIPFNSYHNTSTYWIPKHQF
jgi:protein arginine N-methyltransferase 2